MSYGEIRGLQLFETPSSFSARDEFDQTAGALTGKTAPVGGVWAGAGDADDFSVEATGKTAQRTAVSDASDTGRLAISGAGASAAQAVQVDVKLSGPTTGFYGVLARYINANNYLTARIGQFAGTTAQLRVQGRVGGGSLPLIAPAVLLPGFQVGVFYTIRLVVQASGRWEVWVFPAGSSAALKSSGQNSDLATGGALATGSPGIHDYNDTAVACTRNYDNFLAFVPTVDAAVFASQSCEIRHDRAIREDSTGAIWTPVSEAKGDYLRLPPAGLEGRTCRVIVKASRNDPDTGTDPGIDDISARLHYRPSWLTVPGEPAP